MSRFYWPEPDLSFLPGAKAIGEGEARYFVCHNNNILQLVDEKEAWRPATREELGQFDGVHEHYMGTLSGKKCFAVHVSEPGSAGFASLRMNIQNIGPTLFNLAGRALQVCDWYRSHQFCGRCGKSTTDSKRDRSTVCAGCKLNFYPRLSPRLSCLCIGAMKYFWGVTICFLRAFSAPWRGLSSQANLLKKPSLER